MLKRFFYRKENYKQLEARIEQLETKIENQAIEQNTTISTPPQLGQTPLVEPKQEDSTTPCASLHIDDLTLIKGIGPKAVQRLNEVGIYNFKQLSQLNAEEVATLNDKISRFAGRIARENWIGQATKLVYKIGGQN